MDVLIKPEEDINLKMDFSKFIIVNCPPTAIYVPNFISNWEEQCLLSQIERTPKTKWTQLLKRRLINYGGVPHPKCMVAMELPTWLQKIVDRINNLGVFESNKANHVLVNEYQPGQGIMPHTDGPLFSPIITTISLGSHTILEFAKRSYIDEDQRECMIDEAIESIMEPTMPYNSETEFKLLLEPCSLLILKESLYSDYLHSISEVKEDILCERIYNYNNCHEKYGIGDCLLRSTRTSLTIRHVPKTTKLKLNF